MSVIKETTAATLAMDPQSLLQTPHEVLFLLSKMNTEGATFSAATWRYHGTSF